MDERGLELRVGILIALAIAGAIVLLVLLGQFRCGRAAALYVDFTNAGGVPNNAPVRLAGVRVGRVAAVGLYPTRVDAEGKPLPVEFALDLPGAVLAELREDTRVLVATQGVLGEPFIEIEPGTPNAPPLKAGAHLRGVDPARMDLLTARLSEFLDSATAVLGREHGLQQLVERATRASERLDALLAQNGPVVTQAISDASAAARDLRQLLAEDGEGRRAIADLAQTVALLRRDIPAITSRVQQAADGVASLTSNFGPEDARRIKEALAQYARAGESLNQVATRADRLLAGIEAGQGTLGALAKDPALYQDIRDLITDLKRHPWKVFWKQ